MMIFEQYEGQRPDRVKLIFIGPESDHWQCLSLTDSLTNSLPNSRFVNLMLPVGKGRQTHQLALLHIYGNAI